MFFPETMIKFFRQVWFAMVETSYNNPHVNNVGPSVKHFTKIIFIPSSY